MKISISQQNDNVNFKPVEINSLQDLVKQATKYNYSTGIFKNNYRKKDNFIQADFIAIDVDNDDPNDTYTIEGAKEIFKDYKHIIMPTKSHRKDKNGRIADRFRVILFLETPITDAKNFTATWVELLNYYPAADKACKDAARFYYPSPEVFSVMIKGKTWPVTDYVPVERNDLDIALSSTHKGKLSKQTMIFLTEGAPAGRRNVSLFKAAKDMQEQGYTLDDCRARIASMITLTKNWETDYLNEKDDECIANAYSNDPMYEKRISEETTSVFNFQTLDAMVKDAGDVEWVAEGLLTKGGFSIISGPPKAGKSTLVRQLVKSICQGNHFLGRDVTQGSVLYLTFEEQPSVLKTQFEAVGINSDDPIMIHTGAVFDDRALDDLKEAIFEYEPTIVVLDTLFDIVQLESINAYKEVKQALSKIRALGRDTGAHILGVHHTNKSKDSFGTNSSILGSQAIFGAVDCSIRFQQEGNKRYLYSTGKHGRHYDAQEIIFDFKTQSYTLGEKRQQGDTF